MEPARAIPSMSQGLLRLLTCRCRKQTLCPASQRHYDSGTAKSETPQGNPHDADCSPQVRFKPPPGLDIGVPPGLDDPALGMGHCSGDNASLQIAAEVCDLVDSSCTSTEPGDLSHNDLSDASRPPSEEDADAVTDLVPRQRLALDLDTCIAPPGLGTLERPRLSSKAASFVPCRAEVVAEHNVDQTSSQRPRQTLCLTWALAPPVGSASSIDQHSRDAVEDHTAPVPQGAPCSMLPPSVKPWFKHTLSEYTHGDSVTPLNFASPLSTESSHPCTVVQPAFSPRAFREATCGPSPKKEVQQRSRSKGAKTSQSKPDAPARQETLRTQLRDLAASDDGCVLLVRKLQTLGLDSAVKVEAYFSAFGKVDRVMVTHSKPRLATRLRLASVGFVVFNAPEGVQAALARGPEHTVCGTTISVASFQSHDVDADESKTK